MTKSETKCCEKCQKVEGEYFDAVLSCQQSDCTCHTPPQTGDWEERFHKRFDGNRYETVPEDMDVKVEDIKSFINQVATEERAKGYAEGQKSMEQAVWEAGSKMQ